MAIHGKESPNEPVYEISNNVVCATSKASDQPAHMRSLIRAFASRLSILIVKLLTEHHLEFLSLKGGCRGSSASTHVKMPYCWKSHATAQMSIDHTGKCIRRFAGIYAYCQYFIDRKW